MNKKKLNSTHTTNYINSLQFSIENAFIILKKDIFGKIIYIEKKDKYNSYIIYKAQYISDNQWKIDYSIDLYNEFYKYIKNETKKLLKIYDENTFFNIIESDIKKIVKRKSSTMFIQLNNKIDLKDKGNEKQNQIEVFNKKITIEHFYSLINKERANLNCLHCKKELAIESHIIPNFLLQGLQKNNLLYKGYPFDLILNNITKKQKIPSDFLLEINANNKEAKFPVYCNQCDNNLFSSFENHNLFFTKSKNYLETINLINKRYQDYVLSQINFLTELKQKIGYSDKYLPFKNKEIKKNIFNSEQNLKKVKELILPINSEWEKDEPFYNKEIHFTFEIKEFPQITGFSFIPGSKFPYLFNQIDDSGLKRSIWKHAYSIFSVFIHNDKSGNKRKIINLSFYHLSISDFSLLYNFFHRNQKIYIIIKDILAALFLNYSELFFDPIYINQLDFKRKSGLLNCLALRNFEYSNKNIFLSPVRLPNNIKMNCLKNKPITDYRTRQVIYHTIFSDLFPEMFLQNYIYNFEINSPDLINFIHVDKFFFNLFHTQHFKDYNIVIDRTYDVSNLYGGTLLSYKLFYLKNNNQNIFIAKRYQINNLDTTNIVNKEFEQYLMQQYYANFSTPISKKDIEYFILKYILYLSKQEHSGTISELITKI